MSTDRYLRKSSDNDRGYFELLEGDPSRTYCATNDQDVCHRYQIHMRHFATRLNVALGLVNITLLIALITTVTNLQHNLARSTHSPAEHLIEHQPTIFDKYGHLGGNPFSQKPGAELDNAWHQQLAGMNIRISEKWLTPFGAKSIKLSDGPGVIAQLGVYHELHCLKKLKYWNYRSHYYRNVTGEEIKEEEAHIEHCLEWLRVAALCRGDITLTTFRWSDARKTSLETEYPIPHKCVNAEKILEWSENNAVDIRRDDLLVRD